MSSGRRCAPLSRDFLTPWEPIWPANDLTRTAFRSRIRQYWRDIDEDAAYPYFIFDAQGEVLVGALTLSNVRRGVAQTANARLLDRRCPMRGRAT